MSSTPESGTGSSLARAYLLWGEDTISRGDIVRRFRARMLARPAGDLNLSEFHAPDISARLLTAACDTIPFIDDRRLVIVHRLFSWRPRAASTRRSDASERASSDPLKAERSAFVEYLPRLAPQTTLVLVEGALSQTQRQEIEQALPRGRADVRAFPSPRGRDLERWIASRAAARNGSLAPRVSTLLVEHGPPSLEALDQEIAKLVAYADGEPVSVRDLNELLVGGEIVIFDLLDAVAEGRSSDALAALRRLHAQGQRPEELAPQLIGLIRRLLVCNLALAERVDQAEIQRRLGVSLIDKLRFQARLWSVERLHEALQQVLCFDRQVKTGELEPVSGLELLIAELAAMSRSAATQA